MWPLDLIDDFVHLMNLRRLWRIYAGVALTFMVIVLGTRFFNQEKTAYFFMAVVLVIGIIASVFWHNSATFDE